MAEFVDWAWRQGAFLPASANSLVEPDATGDRFVVTPYTCAIVRPTADTVVDLLRLRSRSERHAAMVRSDCRRRDGERKWGDYSGWREDDDLRTMVRTCLDNEMGGWILVEDDGEDGSQIACGEDASPTTVSED